MRIPEKTINISDCEKLRVQVSVIGYERRGETILILFIDRGQSDKVVFSIVVDYYQKQGTKDWIDILLKRNNIDRIDLFCWTHPHLDHSRGLPYLIDNYIRENTIIIVPSQYNSSEYMPHLLEKEGKITSRIYNDALKYERELNNIRYKQSSGGTDSVFQINLQFDNDPSDIRQVDLFWLTPNDSVLATMMEEKRIEDINSLSLSFALSIDDYILFFGGDTVDEQLETINKQLLNNIRWVKVPHHSSLGAKDFPNKLPNMLYSASTVFRKQLPEKNVCDSYQKASRRFFLTGSLDGKGQKCDYGRIDMQYDFYSDRIELSVDLYGNAIQYK